MDYKMEIVALLICVIPCITSITITSNGNSPEIKMVGGMMVDAQTGFVPMESKIEETTVKVSRAKKRKSSNSNSTRLSINERYRRLIPYMTFYYANDLATPTTDNVKNFEVEKAEIVEAGGIGHADQREPKKVVYQNRNIPRYQGNRLTQHNIASANPSKVYYKGGVPVYQIPSKLSQNHNPLLLSEYNVLAHNDFDTSRIVHKHIPKSPGIPFLSATRKPYLNLYDEDTPNVRYYLSEKEQTPKYKLVPYEQTPPVKVPENENVYEIPKKPVPVLIPKEPVYIQQRPARPHFVYEHVNVQPNIVRKQPTIVSESYYEKQRPSSGLVQPVIESGFKPILHSPHYTQEPAIYPNREPETIISENNYQKQQEVTTQSEPNGNYEEFKPNYYQYVVEQTTYAPPQATTPSNKIPLATLLNSLQLNKSIPKPITKENVGSSIRTLLQVLNILKAVPQQNSAESPVLSTPKPFVAPKLVKIGPKPVIQINSETESASDEGLHEEPYLAPVNPPSQHLDENQHSSGGSSQQFPLQQSSDEEGGTPGHPGVDYPILTTIPETSFNCKTQRYKGFFADPETRCQVWHYCDLNGGQASFLCPNGTIFSQAGLTCDWWFNVRCAQTTQLYVLNESLYKYILPHSPKFPEDYSGPLVDKYLTLKFKEMEEEFKKNKNKKGKTDKDDSDEESDESSEDSTEKDNSGESSEETDKSQEERPASEVSVIVDSPGESGKVERLQD